MAECKECYSAHSRITPLLEPRNCLENHTQYICGTCGRCICIDRDEKRGVQRWNFPFKTLETAKLYLRTADASMKKPCGIYEITDKNGRRSYKIFSDCEALTAYLAKNRDKRCETKAPLYQRETYEEMPDTQIRRLTQQEVEQYLLEQQKNNGY
ncbi:hypothetical protein [Acetanaerobacterium elongatum]|uniref:Uncharacterized protein n=1 Tax=Acetanaerobacterium elongatum TaxID=258515 RepID=A0A1H0E118_9FIRM|nr:hypothetical protein [Acetanaerobacterium elongatum]SDN76092.1 hypothetical protein SAMN05192585_13125 [Acetanaerobacterium elongatum]